MTVIEEINSDDEEPRESHQETEEERDARWKRQEEKEAERVQHQFDLSENSRMAGNSLFTEGKLEEACEQYDEALRHLHLVGNLPENRLKADKANLVLHLNLSQAKLRSKSFEDAKDHATSAWAIDQENVKALYRRAMAQAGLARESSLFQESEAKGACEDLEALLRIEPTNAEAKKQLRELRQEMRAHEMEQLQKQKETWAGVFGPKVVTDGEDAVDDKPLPMIRPLACESDTPQGRHCVIAAEGVAVGRGREGPVLSEVDLNLPERWCVGLYAKDSSDERKALIDVLTRKVRPSAGKLVYPKKPKAGVNPNELIIVTTPIMLATVVGAAAILFAIVRSVMWWSLFIMFGLVIVMTAGIVAFLWYEQQREKRPPAVLHMRARGWEDWKPSDSKTVEALLAKSLPSKIPKEERPLRAKDLLKAVVLEDKGSCLFGSLSESEKQLVYILRCFVIRTRVIVCDEPLRDMEVASQSRVMRMLRRMKQECKTSFLYISSDMQQLSLVSDSLGMLGGRKLCELGPAEEVLFTPRHPEMKEVIAESNVKNMMESGIVKGSGSLREFYDDLLKDSALAGMWVPKHVD